MEHDSDEEEGEVVVFDGEVEEAKNRDERERRGKEMKDRLMLRRRSDYMSWDRTIDDGMDS